MDETLLKAEFQKQESVCHVAEGKQQIEDWFAKRTYCSPVQKKILLLFPLLQENKRNLTKEICYSIKKSFEQCTIHSAQQKVIGHFNTSN